MISFLETNQSLLLLANFSSLLKSYKSGFSLVLGRCSLLRKNDNGEINNTALLKRDLDIF